MTKKKHKNIITNLCQKLMSKHMKIKYFLIIFFIFIIFSCKINDKYNILDGHTDWSIERIISKDKNLENNNAVTNIFSGNNLYISYNHNKIAIILNNEKQIIGDFKIKFGKLKDSIIISNSKNTIFNGMYHITLNTINSNSFFTHYRLLLESKKIFITAEKIIIEPH